jgi:hypothetical protein
VPTREVVAVHPAKGIKLPGADKRGHVTVTTQAQAAAIRDRLVKAITAKS